MPRVPVGRPSASGALRSSQCLRWRSRLPWRRMPSAPALAGIIHHPSSPTHPSQPIGSATSIRLVAAYMSADQSELGKLQQAVLDAQKAVDAAIATATTAYNNALSVCAAVTSNPNPPPTSTQVSACESAISAALDAENQVRIAQNTLVDASKALDDFLQKLAKDETTTTTTPPPTPPPTTAEAKAPSTPAP